MKENSLQNKITTNKLALPGSIIITLACWVVVYVLVPRIPAGDQAYSLWKMLGLPADIPEWSARIISLLVYLATGYFLIALNNAYGIIRIRASVQTCFYFMFVVACPAIQILNQGDVSALLFVISIYFLFGSYQQAAPAGYLFNSFLFASFASLAFPQITCLFPLLLLGALMFNALNMKSFMGAILGWAIPYWFLFTYAYVSDKMELFHRPFEEMLNINIAALGSLQPWELATIGYFLLLYIGSTLYNLVIGGREKIRTRLYLRYLMILDLFIFAFIILQPHLCMDLLPLLLAGLSIQVAHVFVHSENKVANGYLSFTLGGLVLLFCFNLWMLSSIS